MKFLIDESLKKRYGVYLIKNLRTNLVYVGCTVSGLYKRYKEHYNGLVSKKHYAKRLQKAWDKGFEEDFEFTLLELCDKEVALDREQYWLDFYQAYLKDKGYNSCWSSKNSTGFRHTEESLILIGQRSKERAPHPNTIEALRKSNTGRKPSKRQLDALLARTQTPVIQLDLHGNFLKEWPSAAEAGRSLKIDANNINACSRGRCKSFKNFMWVKKKDYDPSKKYQYKPLVNGVKM